MFLMKIIISIMISGKNIRYNSTTSSPCIIEPITVVAAIIMINSITGINTAINMYMSITEFSFSEYS